MTTSDSSSPSATAHRAWCRRRPAASRHILPPACRRRFATPRRALGIALALTAAVLTTAILTATASGATPSDQLGARAQGDPSVGGRGGAAGDPARAQDAARVASPLHCLLLRRLPPRRRRPPRARVHGRDTARAAGWPRRPKTLLLPTAPAKPSTAPPAPPRCPHSHNTALPENRRGP